MAGIRFLQSLWEEIINPLQWQGSSACRRNPAFSNVNHKIRRDSRGTVSSEATGLYPDLKRTQSWGDEESSPQGPVISTTKEQSQCNARLLNNEASFFMTLLTNCTRSKDLEGGIKVHGDVLNRGLIDKCSDSLITMYAKCGELSKAKELLDMYKSKDALSWTAVISGYSVREQSYDVLDCFEQMQQVGVPPNGATFACTLKACGNIMSLEKGEVLHDKITRLGFLENNVVLGTSLVDMYAKCGALGRAQKVLNELPTRNVVSWTALISGHAQAGQAKQALRCFEQMQEEGLSPNAVTFASVLKACAGLGAVHTGEQIHCEIARQGLLEDMSVLGSVLVDMYAKCGALFKAQEVLESLPVRNVVAWSALIGGYAREEEGDQALICFEQMKREGLSPNAVTFVCILKACGCIAAVQNGERIHVDIASQGLLRKDVVLGTALVDMYAKCGSLAKAEWVLEKMTFRDSVSWNALVSGYAQQSQGEEALRCYERMQREGVIPTAVTFCCILKACGGIGAVNKGEQIHDNIDRQGLLGNNVVLGNALVDMYVKCGALGKAQEMLDRLHCRAFTARNALMVEYAHAQEGQSQQIECETFSCLLNPCSHLGHVDHAQWRLVSMSRMHGMKTESEHYPHVFNRFNDAGHLDKTTDMVKLMPSWLDIAVGPVLLNAC